VIAGTFVKVEPMNGAFLVTWSRGEIIQHAAFATKRDALIFAEEFIGTELEEVTTFGGHTTWTAARRAA
jgi:hypothetical protein